jgi:uncharacterized protein (TIGR03382 family)
MRIALAALVLLVANAQADTTAQNLEKYRALRHRLVSEFVSVGPGQGQSQPAPERMDTVGLMKWGDGTIALGFYLGVLATEHYILSHPTQFPGAAESAADLDATRDELYNALLALERLDLEADAAFPSPCSTAPNLNGFFLRDDVPADFYTHFAGITTIQSDFVDPTLRNKEESQDQVYHVQHGLALVIALVPASVSVQGKSLRAWAVEQATRITKHFTKGDWIIRNPACANRAVNRGENAVGFSYGETLATAYLTEGAYQPTTNALFKNIWDTLRQSANPTYSDEDNLHMALSIMAVGDGYGTDTPQVIATLAATQDWPLYPLLHRVLHPASSTGFCTTTAATVNPRARAMLDELPLQSEPACPGANGPAPHGFTTHNRFIRGKSQAYVGPDGCEGVRYHGLDYMLLHNLYAIATPGTWNGNPDADPCAPPIEEPDGMPVVDSDAGVVEEPDPSVDEPAGGCGCQAQSRGTTWPLLMVTALMLRRRRYRRRTLASSC